MTGSRHLLPESPAAGAPADYGYQAGSKASSRPSAQAPTRNARGESEGGVDGGSEERLGNRGKGLRDVTETGRKGGKREES